MRSARELVGFNFDIQAFSKGVPTIRPNIKAIQKLESICANQERISVPKQSELKQVYHNFILKSQGNSSDLVEHFNSIRLTRRLSWALTYSENTAPFNVRIADSPLLHKALGLFEMRFNASIIMGVFEALLQSWNSRYSTLMRRFLKKHLEQYDRNRRRLLNLKKNQDCFCEDNGPTQLALRLMRERIPLAGVWDHLELQNHTHNYSYFGNLAIAYIHLARRTGLKRATLEDIVAFLDVHDSDETAKSIISSVIEQLSDGTNKHTINSENEEVLIEPLSDGFDEGLSPSKIFSFYKQGYRFEWDITQPLYGGRKIQYIKLTPIDTYAQASYLLLGIDTKTKQIYKLIEVGNDGTETTLTIGSFKTNSEIPTSTFVFSASDYPNYYIDRF